MRASGFAFRVIQRPAAGGDWTAADATFRTRHDAAAEAVALRRRGRLAEVVGGGTAGAEAECARRNRAAAERRAAWVAEVGS